jgi:4-hydroxy-4-methyl-2-oxoglutarate aldolase
MGISPVPDNKSVAGVLNGAVCCGGETVSPGDLVVAPEEGMVIVPAQKPEAVLTAARARPTRDVAQTLAAWEAATMPVSTRTCASRVLTSPDSLPP